MVFLGPVMMPFSYGSKVRSVPEFLLLRFDKAAHLLSSILFACAAALIAGDQGADFVSAIAGFVAGAVAMVVVTLFTAPKPAEDLQGLVYGTTSPGMTEPPAEGDDAWYRSPAPLGWGAVILAALCHIPF